MSTAPKTERETWRPDSTNCSGCSSFSDVCVYIYIYLMLVRAAVQLSTKLAMSHRNLSSVPCIIWGVKPTWYFHFGQVSDQQPASFSTPWRFCFASASVALEQPGTALCKVQLHPAPRQQHRLGSPAPKNGVKWAEQRMAIRSEHGNA